MKYKPHVQKYLQYYLLLFMNIWDDDKTIQLFTDEKMGALAKAHQLNRKRCTNQNDDCRGYGVL